MKNLWIKLKFFYRLFFAGHNRWINISISDKEYQKFMNGDPYTVFVTDKSINHKYLRGKILQQLVVSTNFENENIERVEYEMMIEQRKKP